MEKPRLLDRARSVILVRHYRRRSEEASVYWIRQWGAARSEVVLDSLAGRD